jgi:hypothetical protein
VRAFPISCQESGKSDEPPTSSARTKHHLLHTHRYSKGYPHNQTTVYRLHEQHKRRQTTAMTSFWDLPKPVREKIYRMNLRLTTPAKYETYKELSGGTQPAADGTEVQQIMPPLLQVSYRLELEGEFQSSSLNKLSD